MSDDTAPVTPPTASGEWRKATARIDEIGATVDRIAAENAQPMLDHTGRVADLVNINENFLVVIDGKCIGGVDKLTLTVHPEARGPYLHCTRGDVTLAEGHGDLFVRAADIAARNPARVETERQFYTDILGMINTMLARHHVAEQQLKRYIVKETVAASNCPADSMAGIMYEKKLDALNEILKAIDAIDDDTYSYQQRCAFGRLKLLAAAGPSVPVDEQGALPPGAVRGEVLPEENVTKIREIGSPGVFTMPPCGDILQRAQFVRRLGFDPKDHAGLDTWIFSPEVEAILATVVGRRDDAETRDAVRAKLFESYRAYRRDPSPNIDIEFQRDLPGFLSVYAAVAPPNGVPTCPDNLAEPTVGDAHPTEG